MFSPFVNQTKSGATVEENDNEPQGILGTYTRRFGAVTCPQNSDHPFHSGGLPEGSAVRVRNRIHGIRPERYPSGRESELHPSLIEKQTRPT